MMCGSSAVWPRKTETGANNRSTRAGKGCRECQALLTMTHVGTKSRPAGPCGFPAVPRGSAGRVRDDRSLRGAQGLKVKRADDGALVPPSGVLTNTSNAPFFVDAGVTAVIFVSDTTTTFVADTAVATPLP